MKKFTSGASTFLNRAGQYTAEKLGNAEKTEYDEEFENLLQRADKTKHWTERVLNQAECVLIPNPSHRMEDSFYGLLEQKKKRHVTNAEQLGLFMVDAGNTLGPETSYGGALIQCGQTEQHIGQTELDLLDESGEKFLLPLKRFLDNDMKLIEKERKTLENKRLDLDAAKGRVRKAKSPDAKAEAELAAAQTAFDHQLQVTKPLLEAISGSHGLHRQSLDAFVEAQKKYHAKCLETFVDLQTKLGS